ncbi:hypothetical protein GTV15_09840 [Streptomyces sp. SID7803]|nr:hypothetical protein [Streptomyces sp. SID7803]
MSTGWNFTQTSAADFNGDRQADIIARDSAGNLKMWTHNPGGYFNAAKQVTAGWNFSQTSVADYDGNGKADIVARDDSTGKLYIWPATETPPSAPAPNSPPAGDTPPHTVRVLRAPLRRGRTCTLRGSGSIDQASAVLDELGRRCVGRAGSPRLCAVS